MKELSKTIFLLLKCCFLKFIKNTERKYAGKMFNKKKKIIKPWMECKEMEIIKDVLKHSQPQKCLEWGAGYSTIYFSKYVTVNTEWITIEHNKDWAATIENLNQNLNVKIFHIQPNQFPWKDEFGDGAYSDLRDYIEFPCNFGSFDFILIDGRARNDCLIKAYELVKNEGVVVLHDSNRNHYHEPFRLYKYQVIFRDERKDRGGLWIGSKGISINKILDVDKHQNVWRIYNKISKSEK